MASLTVLTSFTRTPAAHGALEVRPIPGYGAHLGRYPTPTPAHGALVFRPLPGYGIPWAGPLQSMGLPWSGPSQDTELPLQVPWQGWAHRNRAHSPHCRALPAHLSLRSDTEHLRAGLELTNSSSDRSVTLGITLCGLLHLVFQRLPLHPGHQASVSNHHPPLLSLTPGFLSLGEGFLEVVSHSWAR